MNLKIAPNGKLKSNAAPALLAAALAALAPTSAFAQAIWTAGHGDLGIAYDAGSLDPHVHIHTGSTVNGAPLVADAEFAPGDAVPYIASSDGLARPAGAQWDFFGVSAGQTVWIFPQIQSATLPFIGFGAEELDPLDWSTPFTLTLTGLSGSGVSAGGQFAVYQTDGFGTPSVAIQSFDGISALDVVTLAAGGHAHYNLAFTQEGLYEATFHIEGVHALDGPLMADATYTFAVGTPIPEPAAFTGLVGLATLVLAATRRRRPFRPSVPTG